MIQWNLDQAQERVRLSQGNVSTAERLVSDAKEELAVAAKDVQGKNGEDIIDPLTGLKQGEKIPIYGNEHMAILFAITSVRSLMAEGRLEEALTAEVVATSLIAKSDYSLTPQSQFAGPETFQMNTADFVNTTGIPENEKVLSATLEYAWKKCDEGILHEPESEIHKLLGGIELGGGILSQDMLDLLGMGTPQTRNNLPENVSLEILRDIFDQIKGMKKCHDELAGNTNRTDNNDIEAGGARMNDEEEDDEDDSVEGRSDFEIMNKSCWGAVGTAIGNQISARREANIKELELPTEESAKICRYNPKAHFRFKSEEANSGVDYLLDSILSCKLRSRPSNYSRDNPVHERVPFQLRTYNNSGFDVDGDIIAMCGDEYFDNIRAEKNFVGYQHVPVPVNLDESKTLCELHDTNGSNVPWDMNVVKRLFKDGKRKKEWFTTCIADSENQLVWAADSKVGTIQAFSLANKDSQSTSDSEDEDEEKEEEKGNVSCLAAKLSFAPPEVRAQSKLCGGSFGLAKGNGSIIGSAITGRLSLWNINSALEDSTKTIEPHIMEVDDSKNFLCGDVHYMGKTNVIVAPLRFDFSESNHSSTIRLYDINAEAVSGLFCGTLGEVSVGKQYCVESHCVFAMSNGVGVVFDTRTYQPTIALHGEKRRGEQILGVPTSSSSMVAFTYGSEEDIKCWDLRSPGSHVYTMSTGNTTVNHLMWHEDTSSLIASTTSKHTISYGRYGGGYMYGDTVNSDEEGEMNDTSYWPRGAVHDPSFFGSRWHCDCQNSPALLQYAFTNGRKMHERPARLKCDKTS